MYFKNILKGMRFFIIYKTYPHSVHKEFYIKTIHTQITKVCRCIFDTHTQIYLVLYNRNYEITNMSNNNAGLEN